MHSVSFSADGNRLAWVGHDSSVSVADATRGMAIYKVDHFILLIIYVYYLVVVWASLIVNVFILPA